MRDIVLVHSDNKLNDMYVSRLAKYFRMHSANNGLKGLRLIKQVQPHMLLTQDELPFLSGLSLLKQVRANLETAAMPVIILSHRHPHHDALGHGANEWIKTTDVDMDDIIQRVFYHLVSNKIIK